MKPGRCEKQFTPDYGLLTSGQYREYFYKGLDPKALAFLKAPVKKAVKPVVKPVKDDGWVSRQPRKWQDDAACKDTDPVVFFAEGHFPKQEYLDPSALWRSLCPQCPVREACRQAARDSESEGIFGGKFFFMERKGNSHEFHEYDDETMPKLGRPRKYASPEAKKEAKRIREREKYQDRKKVEIARKSQLD